MSDEAADLVLLVEDNDIDRDIFGRALQRAGYRVATASGYEAAAAILDGSAEIALMVTDVRLPAVHGFTLARIATVRRPHMKIIYFTGLTELPLHETGIALGKVVHKTEDPDVLVREVRATLAAD